MDKYLHKLLYRSFDDKLSSAEERHLNTALQNSDALRREKAVLQAMRRHLEESAVTQFNSGFAQRITNRLRMSVEKRVESETFSESLAVVFRPLLVTAAVIVIFLMTFNVIQNRSLSVSSIFPKPQVTLEDAFNPTLTFLQE